MSRTRFASAVIGRAASAVVFAAVAGLWLGGCKTPAAASARLPAEPPQLLERAMAPSKYSEPPPSSPLSTVRRDMTHEQVEEIMGAPTAQTGYPTAGTYNPYGSDSGNRVVYKYENEGRVLFAVPKYGGSMRVLRVDYDPTEDGE